ncbi:nuclear transport factor 2 family protein [Promicromonospora sp. NPDC060204]|uniref:nuclear transport factor 2 family protein n=1 Tax=Promicromonospora sp. NPDC060204 TaxID=3347071 RepID=UPI00365FCC7C
MTTGSTVPGPTDQQSDSLVRTVVNAYFDARLAGATPEELAERFHENVDWFIQGDAENVPWIGRKVGRAGVAEHFAQLGENVRPEAFEVDTIMADGNRAVVLGTFRARVIATGRLMDSEYVFDISVDDAGLITRYHMLEDSWAVSEAARP